MGTTDLGVQKCIQYPVHIVLCLIFSIIPNHTYLVIPFLIFFNYLLPHSFIFTTHISFISTANVHYAKFDIGKLMVFMSLFDEDGNVVSGLFVLQNNSRPEKGYCERPGP